ncbi:dual specificity protein phosphatase family protein [Thermobifida halotolerans]|uniref:Dual specificity protein phosphatase family protein n=1 Tax=Thermobifida halotolerans TaxID=483545 RepID=A0A399G4M4_9ACTN|nr:dual specificity protein phosphatase family protein [Thermobifida halotolerans]UOE20801.1 dual specificity protein phosphatase family protein [Thermobifida halotolerans]
MAWAWNDWDVVWDRVAGAMVGGAVAPLLAGESARTEAEYLDGVGGRVAEAVRDLADDAVLLGGGGAGERWMRAVRSTVVGGTVPEAPEDLGEGPEAVGWRAVARTPAPPLDPARGVFPCSQLVGAVRLAHERGGAEAARYAGALAGAGWGVSGIPLAAQRELAAVVPPRELVTAALVAARGEALDCWPQRRSETVPGLDRQNRRPFAVAHPHDPGVVLCTMEYVRDSAEAEAVVSLCRMGTCDQPAHLAAKDTVEVWLHDRPGANRNLHFVLDEAARAVARLRAEGRRVLLHCAACQSRTPAVAARYASLACGVDVVEALRTIISTVVGHLNNPELSRAVAALDGVELADPQAVLFPEGMPELTRTPRI